MPTYDTLAAFDREYGRLSPAQRVLVRAAVVAFVADLKAGIFRPGLRVKRVAGHPDVWEITWDDDGRATFHYGPEQRPHEPHVVWRRVGSHDIFRILYHPSRAVPATWFVGRRADPAHG